MEVALRRRLAGVADVSISQSRQTAAVTFLSGTYEFSAAAFREAVAEADVEVLSLDVEVCGVIDGENGLHSLAEVKTPLVRLRGGHALPGSGVCVSGRLDEPVEPNETHVLVVRARAASGRPSPPNRVDQ